MAVSILSKPLLRLGEKIVNELGMDDSADTLGRWMAHHLAELMEAAEKADTVDKPARSAECADAILTLWKHRREFPDGSRPLAELEPVLRALERLDPSDDRPYYFRPLREEVGEPEQGSETQRWLKLCDNVDHAAKVLIRHCLARAADTASDKSADWVERAEAAGVEGPIESLVIRIVSAEADLTDPFEQDDVAREQIEKRIEHLEVFKKAAAALEADLRKQLGELGTGDITIGIGQE